MSLLTRVDRALAGGLRFHEWRDGTLCSRAASEETAGSSAEERGAYLLLRAPTVPALWAAVRRALAGGRPLVVLPPSSPLEEAILLRLLPAAPPAGAVLTLFTSGSTGDPKAVFHSEASVSASAEQLARAFPGAAPTVSLLPPWGMAGVMFHCLLPAVRGSGVLFSSAPFLEWSAHAGSLFRELEVEIVTLNPFLLEMLLRAGLDPAWTGSVVSLTAPLKVPQRTALQLLAGCQPREIYGMTEAAGPVLLDGKSLGAETRLAATGELEIRGPQLMQGYAANGRFEPAPDWFPTGDLFRLDHGTLAHESRIRDLIDTGGRKVAPRIVEEAMETMPDIAECLAFAVELGGVERIGLLYVRKPACELSHDALAAAVESHIAQSLSPDLRPKWWQESESLPRRPNGKPDRRAARKRFRG